MVEGGNIDFYFVLGVLDKAFLEGWVIMLEGLVDRIVVRGSRFPEMDKVTRCQDSVRGEFLQLMECVEWSVGGRQAEQEAMWQRVKLALASSPEN